MVTENGLREERERSCLIALSNVRITRNAPAVQLLGDAALLLVPSQLAESFGRLAFEGLAAGVPVLAAARGGLTEFVPEGQLVAPADEPNAWVTAIRGLMSKGRWHSARAHGLGAAEAIITNERPSAGSSGCSCGLPRRDRERARPRLVERLREEGLDLCGEPLLGEPLGARAAGRLAWRVILEPREGGRDRLGRDLLEQEPGDSVSDDLDRSATGGSDDWRSGRLSLGRDDPELLDRRAHHGAARAVQLPEVIVGDEAREPDVPRRRCPQAFEPRTRPGHHEVLVVAAERVDQYVHALAGDQPADCEHALSRASRRREERGADRWIHNLGRTLGYVLKTLGPRLPNW